MRILTFVTGKASCKILLVRVYVQISMTLVDVSVRPSKISNLRVVLVTLRNPGVNQPASRKP